MIIVKPQIGTMLAPKLTYALDTPSRDHYIFHVVSEHATILAHDFVHYGDLRFAGELMPLDADDKPTRRAIEILLGIL